MNDILKKDGDFLNGKSVSVSKYSEQKEDKDDVDCYMKEILLNDEENYDGENNDKEVKIAKQHSNEDNLDSQNVLVEVKNYPKEALFKEDKELLKKLKDYWEKMNSLL